MSASQLVEGGPRWFPEVTRVNLQNGRLIYGVYVELLIRRRNTAPFAYQSF